jgi:hypothetical protein
VRGRLLRQEFKFANLPFEKNADTFTAVIRCTCDDTLDSKSTVMWSRQLNGKGPLSAELRSQPVDLTILAKKNDGVFPVNAVYEVTDGRKSVKAHGTREIPIWGFRYTPSPNQALSSTASDQYFNLSYDPELAARSRVLAVVDYLNCIQAK